MRKALEDLIFIGTLEETYTLFKKDWRLKTLTSDEQLLAASSTRDYDQLSRVYALKIATLSRSIIEVNNIELKDLDEKIDLLRKMQQPLIDMLYDKYLDLQRKQDEALKDLNQGSDEIKN
jgi:hypothetical protein